MFNLKNEMDHSNYFIPENLDESCNKAENEDYVETNNLLESYF